MGDACHTSLNAEPHTNFPGPGSSLICCIHIPLWSLETLTGPTQYFATLQEDQASFQSRVKIQATPSTAQHPSEIRVRHLLSEVLADGFGSLSLSNHTLPWSDPKGTAT